MKEAARRGRRHQRRDLGAAAGLAEHGHARRIAADARWQITLADRIVGRLRCYDMQVRRSLLYLLSALRASWRRRPEMVRS